MENISLSQNSYINQQSVDVQNKINNQPSFDAIDKEKLKQDSIEIASKAKENANENFIFRTLRKIGVNNPKKTLKSLAYSILAVIGVAILGNKLSTPANKLGNSIDNFLTGDNPVGKFRNNIVGLLNSGKDKLKQIPTPKFVQNAKAAVKKGSGPKWQLFRGFENGAKGLFSNTIVETLTTAYGKSKDAMLETFTKILGGDKAKAKKLLNEIPDIGLSGRIKKFFGENQLSDDILKKMSDNKIFKKTFSDNTEAIVDALKKLGNEKLSDDDIKLLTKNLDFSQDLIEKLTKNNTLGNDTKAVVDFFKKYNECKGNFDRVKFADKLLDEIAKANSCVDANGIVNKTKLSEVLREISDGNSKFGNGLKNVKMDQGGLLGSWWPANVVNSIKKAITGKESSVLQGNLGDSLLKYGAVRGKLAETAPAKLVQIIPPLVGDQVSNFVNDKSGFGVLLCANLIGNFNNIQDAPTKKQKVQTALNDVSTGSISWLVGMPLTYGAVYSLASLRNIEGKGIMNGIIRTAGKVFGMGLDKTSKLGGLSGIVGGVGRFALAMFVIQPFISKGIDKICSKIFGKPYNAAEAQKEKELEEAKKQVIPELGITQGELMDKIQKNPQTMQRIQQDPKLLELVEKNPKALLDLLDGKDVSLNTNSNPAQKTNFYTSPANRNLINRRKTNTANSNNIQKTPEKLNTNTNNNKQKDNLTYIPSSAPAPKVQSTLSEEQQNIYNIQMEKADKVLKQAEKYL